MNAGDLVAGRYKLLRPIGGGAMGTVWAARHELLGRDFALKFAHVTVHADPASRSKFQTEAQIVGKLRHPNIVDVTDFGEASEAGDCFLAMELLEGESLAERIEKHGPLDSYDAVTIAAEIARGLSAVHAVGIIHRDIKPENIFLAFSPTGAVVPKLLDFGISKEQSDSLATQHAALTGTPAYMSPEQANGETKLDPRTDIWSLGVVLYEMLSGKHPFVAPNYHALMTAIAERPYVPLEPSTPEAVRRVVTRCLERRPGDRFATSEVLVGALEETLDAIDASATPHSLMQRRHRKRTFRDKRWPLVGSVLLVMLVAASLVWLGNRTQVASVDLSPASTDVAPKPSQAPSSALFVVPLETLATSASATKATPPAPTATAAKRPTTTAPTAPTAKRPTTGGKRPSTSVTNPGF